MDAFAFNCGVVCDSNDDDAAHLAAERQPAVDAAAEKKKKQGVRRFALVSNGDGKASCTIYPRATRSNVALNRLCQTLWLENATVLCNTKLVQT